jgi:hypothetical protein
MVTSTAPANGAMGVAVNDQSVTAQFNLPIASAAPGATFTVTTAAPGVNPAGTVTVDPSGLFETFTLASGTSLAPNTLYTVTVTDAQSASTGLAMAAPWVGSFTTGTVVAATLPGVAFTDPATTVPGPTLGAPTTTSVNATFTMDMNPASITAQSFTLAATASGVAQTGAVSYAVGSMTATFMPAAPLSAATTYTATVTKAATNLAGLALAGNTAPPTSASNYTWSFTTGAGADTTPPLLTLEFPANLATAVPLNSVVSATFSKAINFSKAMLSLKAMGSGAGTPVTGSVNYDALTMTATFTPTANLTFSTTYSASVTGVTDLSGNALAAGTLPDPWTFATGTAAAASSGPALGSASTFGIMATSAITNTGGTIINGDVSLAPGSSITGFPPGIINGNLQVDNGAAAQARADLLTAYNTAASLPPGITISAGADLGALYPTGIAPGTYTSGSTMLVSTPLTLDAGGNANAVWVFQVGSSLTTTASLILANGAQASNIFWACSLDGTIGVNTTFYGTILAGRNVTAVTGATVNGRILAGATTAGTIALDNNVINVPSK